MSLVGRFYDPLGILSPIVIPFKVFLQELSQLKQPWDKVLTGEILNRWSLLLKGLEISQPICLPRTYQLESGTAVTHRLYGFCDASAKAYAAVIYLVPVTDKEATPSLVCSKTRVAPLKELTIPGLELLSTVLLARLVNSVTEALSTELCLEEPICYTDSMIAYHWIRGLDKGWRPFVQNRTNEIRKLVPPDRWRHCPGSSNPADIPSRGLTLSELANSHLWFHGPDWLVEHNFEEDDSNIHEIPNECLAELQTKATFNLLNARPCGIAEIIDLKAKSDIDHLLRVTAYVLLFIRRLRGSSAVSLHELIGLSETLWVIDAQQSLKESRHFKGWKTQLNLFLDPSGVWRCGGRLHNAQISYSAKFPILLPSNHHFTTLVIRKAHNRVFHNGVKETLTELRSNYWVLRGRAVVRQYIYHCHICRRFESQPYSAPSPPLPPFRVQEEPPFTYTGVDFAGPLYIKTTTPASSEKVWICIYTCCIVRAIHLEVVPNLSAQSFLRCFKRFAARRGLPKRMVSDNGKTFKSAAKTIRSIMTNEKVTNELSGRKVEWVFNIERAPWWGGIFERMVRSTKRCLKKMIGRTKLSYDELLTILAEVEAIVNSRPLSYISPSDLEEPLTPSHLLVGCRLLSLPDSSYYEREMGDETFMTTPEVLSKRMVLLNRLMQKFWQRWKSEYLLELRNSHKAEKGTPKREMIAEGDVVLVHDDLVKRSFWKIGLVTEVIPGRDDVVRGAVVKVCSGGSCTLLRRPIQCLYPLETSCSELHISKDLGSESGLLETNDGLVVDGSSVPNDLTTPIKNVCTEDEVTQCQLGDISEIEKGKETQQQDLMCSESAVVNEPLNQEVVTTQAHRPTRVAAREARDRIMAQTIDCI